MDNNNEMNKCLKIGKNLRKLMKQDQISFQRLSSKLNIPRSTLFGYAQNTYPKSPKYLKKICNYFNISSDELLFGITDSNNKIVKRGDIVNCKVKILKICKDNKDQVT